MKGDDLSDRLLNFAVRVLRLVTALPRNQIGKHVAGQLLRSGTSAGANYEEARGGESRADFIHKLSIAWKETRETGFWLQIVHRSELVPPRRVEEILTKARQLSAILGKSLATARGKAKPGDP